ncbi:hypothetical protein BCR33DRAFT_794099 [Rhizoclosmatium globosum]|uniref:Uncharacterized protein n=1 Tax=Rhizoclosmatium globosum TaxID=329046 RepID=A0A1Y2AWJ4_9FUNG|nr:hypothetical protein BCR33DRAFT_794099 [Rhizoclosmatium globosum]|eukprot:ORY26938.1 hypothetical protein BCR33DRAFT_794099 [Rhizoclosmatium globosum]
MAAIPAACAKNALPDSSCFGPCFTCYVGGGCKLSKSNCDFSCSGTCIPKAIEVDSSCIERYPGSQLCQVACADCISLNGEMSVAKFLSCDAAAGTAICATGGRAPEPFTDWKNHTTVLKDMNPKGLPVVARRSSSSSAVATSSVTTSKMISGVKAQSAGLFALVLAALL